MIDLLKVDDLTFSYPRSIAPLLQNFSFTLQESEFCAVIGQNGSGKSTFLKIVGNRYQPTHGRIYLNSIPFSHISDIQMGRWVISLTQRMDQCLFFPMTVKENIEIWVERLPATQRQDAWELFEQGHYFERLKKLYDRVVAGLSGGEQQILMFSLAFLSRPKLLLLDEHTSQLDPQMSTAIMSHIANTARERRVGVLMVTHNLQHALEYADKIVIMKEGLAPIEIMNDHTLTLDQLRLAIL
ncbi:MAG: ABC transporter ATP-binding protein [Gammaproteobacteria bacterium]|nr:ABC transporter ATP-binding protein [Gammaproteobacteria bacterium]